MHGYFILYKRTLSSGKKIYYYQAYKPDGTLTSGKSTGCKTKAAAIHYCETLLMQGRIWTGSNISFKNYAEHFFDYDSIWVQNKKDGKVFLYFEKSAKFLSAEIKNGKINILSLTPELADFSVAPPAPASSNINDF